MRTFRECFIELLGEHEAKVGEHRESGLCSTPNGCEGCEERNYCKRLRNQLIGGCGAQGANETIRENEE